MKLSYRVMGNWDPPPKRERGNMSRSHHTEDPLIRTPRDQGLYDKYIIFNGELITCLFHAYTNSLEFN